MTRRILHISTRLILGGSQENTILSCEGQARLGHDVHLAFGPIYGPEGSMLSRVESFNERADGADGGARNHIQTHEIPNLVREIAPIKDRRALAELADLIHRIRPDIVHTHSSKAGILGRLAAWKANPRPGVVHTIHGPPFMPIEGHALQRIRTRLVNHAYTLAERYAARRCHRIVSVADAMTEQFLARQIGSPGQYTTVRSGMDLEPYLHPPPDQTREAIRTKLGFAESDFVVGTVARLAQHKGHDDILDAIGQHMQSNESWKLLWVGDGWWADRLARRVDALGLSDRVVRTGLVPPEQVPGLIRAMDVLCHPSAREGLPRTVPQALLCGVCPVAYDVDGTGEACREMQTGRLVSAGDVSGLREALLWAHDFPDERLALARTGQAACRIEFDTQVMVSRLEDIYADVAQTR